MEKNLQLNEREIAEIITALKNCSEINFELIEKLEKQ